MSLVATIRSMVRLLDRRKRTQVGLLALLSATNAVLEAVGALLVLALVGSFVTTSGLAENPVTSVIKGIVPAATPQRITTITAIVTLVFYVVRSGSALLEQYAQQRLVHRAATSMSTEVLATYLRVPMTFHYQQTSGEVVRNAWYASEMLFRTSLLAAMSILSETLAGVALLAMLLFVAPVATLAVVAGLALVVGGLDRLLRTRTGRWGLEAQDLSSQCLQRLQESFAGLRDVRINNAEGHFVERYSSSRNRLARILWRQGTAANAPRFVLEALFILSVVTAVLLSQASHTSSEKILPILGLYAYTGLRLLPSANRLLTALNNLRYGEGAVHVVTAALDAPQESEPPATANAVPFERELRFDRVTYRYPGADVAVDDVTVCIAKGQRIGVVGHSGSGKSTFVDLLAGLLHPVEGHIFVDGVDLETRTRDWRRQIGYVPQSAFLLDDTVAANVAFGVPTEEVDAAAVWEALERAQVADVVRELPDGIGARVGERGVRLSGGQRQRVAVARALYHQPTILLFDEATAALDNKLEEDITLAIEALSASHTVIIVAHRLSTIRRCDQLLLFEAGSLSATGTFDELVERSDSFRELASLGLR